MSKTQHLESKVGVPSTYSKHAVQPLLGLWFGLGRLFRVKREEADLTRFSIGNVHSTHTLHADPQGIKYIVLSTSQILFIFPNNMEE